MRHAKSSWKSEAASDHARPLNKRGQRDAPRIGQTLATLNWVPEYVLSSDAVRTRETYALMEPFFDPKPRTIFLPTLYLAGIGEIQESVAQVPDDAQTVMLLGHNDGWEHALAWLTGKNEPMTTANAALLEGQGSTWAGSVSQQGPWSLSRVLRPKELDGTESLTA